MSTLTSQIISSDQNLSSSYQRYRSLLRVSDIVLNNVKDKEELKKKPFVYQATIVVPFHNGHHMSSTVEQHDSFDILSQLSGGKSNPNFINIIRNLREEFGRYLNPKEARILLSSHRVVSSP